MEKMISDLPVAVALNANDKFEIEQVSQLESTHLTIAALLSHIDNQLLSGIKGDIDAIELTLGGSSVSLSVVDGRVTTNTNNITSLQTALATEFTNRTNADSVISASVTVVQNNLNTEITNRTSGDNALSARIDDIDDDILGLNGAIAGKANITHTHIIADVTGLQTALNNKEPANSNIQGHIVATNNPHNVTKTQVGLGNVDNTTDMQKPVSTAQQAAIDTKAPLVHTHTIANVTGLQAAIDGKAAATHGHSITDVTGLQTALNNKAAITHTHIISEVTGLQGALDAKSVAIQDVADDLTVEIIARAAVQAEVEAARGAFADLDARLDNLAVSAGAVTSVFGRAGDIVAQAGDYDFSDLGVTPTTLAGYGITDAAALIHTHSASDITSGVLGIARGGTGGEGFRYIMSATAPTGVPTGTRWLDTNTGREYTLHQDIDNIYWVQWSGGQAIQGTDPMGLLSGAGGEWGSITGTLSAQTDLQTALDGKSSTSHTHTITNVTGLQAALDGKTDTGHTHTIANVTGLQAAIDAKADTAHTHTIANVTGLQAALDAKAASTALDAKANVSGQTFTGAVTATSVSDSAGNVRNLLPVTANATTTLSSTHINKVVEKTNTTAYTYTIAPSLGVQGDVITIINSGTAGDITVARGTGVALYRSGTDANLTVAPGTMVTLYRSATTNRWLG